MVLLWAIERFSDSLNWKLRYGIDLFACRSLFTILRYCEDCMLAVWGVDDDIPQAILEKLGTNIVQPMYHPTSVPSTAA